MNMHKEIAQLKVIKNISLEENYINWLTYLTTCLGTGSMGLKFKKKAILNNSGQNMRVLGVNTYRKPKLKQQSCVL